MGTYLTTPIREKNSFDGENAKFAFGGCHMQGWRTSQEDAAIHQADIGDRLSMFAVFDGHGSNEVAAFVEHNFVQLFKKSEHYKTKDYAEALKEACIEVDNILKTPEG